MFSLEVLLQPPNSASVSDENGKSLALDLILDSLRHTENMAPHITEEVILVPSYYSILSKTKLLKTCNHCVLTLKG